MLNGYRSSKLVIEYVSLVLGASSTSLSRGSEKRLKVIFDNESRIRDYFDEHGNLRDLDIAEIGPTTRFYLQRALRREKDLVSISTETCEREKAVWNRLGDGCFQRSKINHD
jgi:hypothetical protein